MQQREDRGYVTEELGSSLPVQVVWNAVAARDLFKSVNQIPRQVRKFWELSIFIYRTSFSMTCKSQHCTRIQQMIRN
jgi:hypothetical protein